MKFEGTIIAESFKNDKLFKNFKILDQKVERVTEKHKTPWLKQWTLYKVEIEENKADEVALELSISLDYDRKSSWYADFKNDSIHCIIFKGKIFQVEKGDKIKYQQAEDYGLALGIPDYQMDFVKRFV